MFMLSGGSPARSNQYRGEERGGSSSVPSVHPCNPGAPVRAFEYRVSCLLCFSTRPGWFLTNRNVAESGERSPTMHCSCVALLPQDSQNSRNERTRHAHPGAGVLLVRLQDGPAGEGLRDHVLGVHREGADGDGRQAQNLQEELAVRETREQE